LVFISVSSEGTAMADGLSARHVNWVKILFLPSIELKRNIEDISFDVE
jgi:hypothetical protein